jgi:hypothetical protein
VDEARRPVSLADRRERARHAEDDMTAIEDSDIFEVSTRSWTLWCVSKIDTGGRTRREFVKLVNWEVGKLVT